jgi:hypothetical protein
LLKKPEKHTSNGFQGDLKLVKPTFSRLFKPKNNIYEKRLRETAKLDFVYH